MEADGQLDPCVKSKERKYAVHHLPGIHGARHGADCLCTSLHADSILQTWLSPSCLQGLVLRITCQKMEWKALPPLENHSAREGAWDKVFLPSVTPGQIVNPLPLHCGCCLAKGRVGRLGSFNLKSRSLTPADYS